jgi:hypothetical protein
MIGKRVAAFTIMEITVAMLISALVIAITWTAYLSFSKSYQSYNKKHEDMAVVLTLDEVLRKDFDRAEMIRRDSSGMVVQFADHTIRYAFNTAFVLRTVPAVKTDTFKVKSDSLSMSFESIPVNEVSEDKEKNRIDQLDLSFFLEKEKIPYHYRKTYSSADLIHRKNYAVH